MRLLPEVSRATVQRWIGEGRVKVDGKICRAKQLVRGGSRLEVEPSEPPPSLAVPDPDVPFQVLHEDPHLIVVDKPAGIVVHPARGHASGTLVNGLIARGGFERASADERDPNGAVRPGVVHRIDKDTSGILVVAKDEPTREGLKQQLSTHSMERVYLALTLGVPKSARIESLYDRHPRSRLRFTSKTSTGKRAVTNVRVLEGLAGGRTGFVECRLETGRTHQIRVHLSEQSGTPLLADWLYGRTPGDADVAEIAQALGRQALHAAVLGFVHPATGSALRFESPLPADLTTALAALRSLTA
ncbi:MAG: Ribosomal large subunit pseudouridine synthase [Polyangiaceae bacterium]|nr:Ribosomal large subunit pseudouridine synthase [Polyangiaceae bacterium]